MTRSIFDPTSSEAERSGSRFTLPDAEQGATEIPTAEERAAEAEDEELESREAREHEEAGTDSARQSAEEDRH